jgi:hypothetical protein
MPSDLTVPRGAEPYLVSKAFLARESPEVIRSASIDLDASSGTVRFVVVS